MGGGVGTGGLDGEGYPSDELGELTEVLGADEALSVEEALGVSAESMTHPIGMIASAHAFNERQRQLRSGDPVSDTELE